MEDRDARQRDLQEVQQLQQQLHQLDMEARGSALTPGEAEKNADQRAGVADRLRELEGQGGPGDGAPA